VARIWLEEGCIVPGDSVGEFLKPSAIEHGERQDGPVGAQDLLHPKVDSILVTPRGAPSQSLCLSSVSEWVLA
jgi:hypothetical protein